MKATAASRANVFAGDHIDRLGHRRRDEDWLREHRAHPDTRYVVVWNQGSLIDTGTTARPVLLPPQSLTAEQRDAAVLLGALGDRVCFALDLGEGPRDNAPAFPAGTFRGLRTAGMLLPRGDAALLAYAQAMVLWHRRHRYCGRCGTQTRMADAGHVRRCAAESCAESAFPRLDPAIIVLVEHDECALLGRQPAWPKGIYSTIAGFVEPGESLEDAVRREVAEETGVQVGRVRYHSSQPWPFPSSLMLGFVATAIDPDIELRDGELEDAQWFSRAAIGAGLKSGTLAMPASVSISRQLIAHWFDAGPDGRLAELTATHTTG